MYYPPTKRVFNSLVLLFALCTSLLAGLPTDQTKNAAGINVWHLADWGGDNAIVDIMQHARNWHLPSWTSDNNLTNVDEYGWPLQDASTVIFGVGNTTGTYHLVFEGQANVSLLWTPGSVTNYAYDSGTNISTANVNLTAPSTGGLVFTNTKLTSTSATNTGIKHVRLYRPGYATDGSQVFTDPYLEIVGKFQLVRYMTWLKAWNSPIADWSDRRRPEGCSVMPLTVQGVTDARESISLEHCIMLSNTIGADAWICVPVQATDDYITKLAQLIRYGSDGTNPYTSAQANPVYPPLNPELKVYLEYGNEIWNGTGRCQSMIHNHTEAIRGAPYDHPIEYDGESDEWTLVARWSAWRTVAISTLFRQVFGDNAINDRVRITMMGQIGGGWLNARELPFIEGFYSTYRPATDPYPNPDPHPASYYLYGTGGAPYYGVNSWTSPAPDTFFAAGNWPDAKLADRVAKDSMLAVNWGLHSIAYEGGFSMGGDGGSNSFTQAQKLTIAADARLEDMVIQCHDIWTQNGGEELTYFAVSDGNSDWGFTWDIYNSNTPKLNAINEILNNRQRVDVTLGQRVPGTLVIRDQPLSIAYGAGSWFNLDIGGEATRAGRRTGDGPWGMAYPVNTIQPGYYTISVRMCDDYKGTFDLKLYLNGVLAGAIPVTSTGARTLFNTATLEVPIRQGLNMIRLVPDDNAITTNFFLRSVTFAYSHGFLNISTTSLPSATVGIPYSTPFTATGALGESTWTITAGSLPEGLSLSPTGILSGTPAISTSP